MIGSLLLSFSERQRFESFLHPDGPEFFKRGQCQMWTGAVDRKGYGIFQTSTMQPKTQRAHRIAYMATYGPIPAGMQVQHMCDRPGCCNPEHLSVGAPVHNSAKMVLAGRQARGLRHGMATIGTETIQQIYDLCCEKLPQCKPHAKGNEAIYKAIAEQFGVSYSHVRNIHRGRRRVLNDRSDPNSPIFTGKDRGGGQRAFT